MAQNIRRKLAEALDGKGWSVDKLRDRIRVGCAGKVVSAFDIARAMALGADWCNSARGFMMALGCIQAQACHTGHCPTGVTTQDPQRQKALDVGNKTQRVANFHQNTLEALQELVQAAGLTHPNQISPTHIVRRVDGQQVAQLDRLLPRVAPGALLADADAVSRDEALHPVFRLYWGQASAQRFGVV